MFYGNYLFQQKVPSLDWQTPQWLPDHWDKQKSEKIEEEKSAIYLSINKDNNEKKIEERVTKNIYIFTLTKNNHTFLL